MMPKVMISANSVMMLIDPPSSHSATSEASTDTGMPMATQNATRPFRNTYRTTMTSRIPPTALSIIRPMRSSTSFQISS